jgi:hypothetical protein
VLLGISQIAPIAVNKSDTNQRKKWAIPVREASRWNIFAYFLKNSRDSDVITHEAVHKCPIENVSLSKNKN